MTKKEIILKVDEDIRNTFKAHCSSKGLSMTFVLTKFMKEYVKTDIIETPAPLPKPIYVNDEGQPIDSFKLPADFFGKMPKELEDKLPKSYKPEDF